MPTMSTDSHSTSATTRPREKPSARSAAISPSRWFTDTVSSTVMSSSANASVTVGQHGRDLPEVGEAGALQPAEHLLVGGTAAGRARARGRPRPPRPRRPPRATRMTSASSAALPPHAASSVAIGAARRGLADERERETRRCRRRGDGRAAAPRARDAQRARSTSSLPGARRSAAASAWLTTTSCRPARIAAAQHRPRPRVAVHAFERHGHRAWLDRVGRRVAGGRCRSGSGGSGDARRRVGLGLDEPDRQRRAHLRQAGESRRSVALRIAHAVAARARSSPVAVTRMSKPVRSSRSRIDMTSPSDSSSMSKSSAPTAATPRTPSAARAGCRTRLRHAKASAFIAGPAAARCAAGAPTRRRPWRTTPSGTAIATHVQRHRRRDVHEDAAPCRSATGRSG